MFRENVIANSKNINNTNIKLHKSKNNSVRLPRTGNKHNETNSEQETPRPIREITRLAGHSYQGHLFSPVREQQHDATFSKLPRGRYWGHRALLCEPLKGFKPCLRSRSYRTPPHKRHVQTMGLTVQLR